MKKFISFILAAVMLCSIFVLPAAADTDNRVWFDLKGNSRFFVKKGKGIYENRLSYIDYLPGVDFAGFVAAPTGVFATDQTAVVSPKNGGGMFFYTLGVPSDTHGRWSTTVLTEVTENSAYWTINGVNYLLKLNENVIKVCKNAIDTSALTDTEKVKKYKSINEEAVIDVTDGRYKSIGLLAGIVSGKTRKATVTLVYSDESVEKTITVNPPSMTDAYKYSNGNIYLKNFTNSNDNDNGAHGFIPFTINTDSTKTLKEIKIKDADISTDPYCIYVLSAWGVKTTLAEVIAELDAAIEKATTVAELEAIDVKSIEEEFNCTLTEQKNLIADKIAELKKAEQLVEREFYYYPIEYNRDAFATAAEVYKYYPSDSNFSVYPSTDVSGNPITNHINGYIDNKTINKKLFVIDAISGTATGKLTGEYLDSSNAKKTYSYTLKINGNEKFNLQSTDADGTMNFLYKHKDINFKMGPIGGTGAHLTSTGGYNVQVLPNADVTYTVSETVEEQSSVNILMSTDYVNSSNSAWSGLFPVEITYAGGATETKYVLSTVLHPANMTGFMEVTGGSSSTTGDGDRLAKTVIYVPKDTDVSTGANIAAAEKYLSETNSEEVTGKALTLNDVKFPSDDLIIKGESVLFGDFNYARTNAFSNPRQYCPVGYVDFLQIPVEQDVASVKFKRDISAALNWVDENEKAVAVKYGNYTAYIPVTIDGASEDYLYFAKLGRLCENQQEIYAITVAGKSLQDKIDNIESRIEKLSDSFVQNEEEELLAIKEEIEEIIAGGVVTKEDFDATLYTKIESLYEQYEKFQLYGDDIKELITAIDNLPESYSKETGKAAAEIKVLVDGLINKGQQRNI